MTTDIPTRSLAVGPIGRLGRWTATNSTAVVTAWIVVALGLGFLAPRVESSLSGAGWEATGSESVQARHLIDNNLGGLGAYGPTVVVHSAGKTVSDPGFRLVLGRGETAPQSDPAGSAPLRPSTPPNPPTAVIRAGAAPDSDA